MSHESGRPHVVILGGGFGGTFALRRLKRVDADVTLVDRSTTNLFQPLLYQCATGILSEGQITEPLRSLFEKFPNTKVLQGDAIDISPEASTVVVRRPDGTTLTLEYDYLIVAVGMRQSYFGHDEFSVFAPGMKTLDDALVIRQRIFGAFEMAESLPPGDERSTWLTFAVVGAGPTGVELAGQIRELATKTLAEEFHDIDPRSARVLLFDGVEVPLNTFGPKLAARAVRDLERLGVELHMGVLVTDVDDEGLVATSTKDATSTRFLAKTVLWTAGVQAVDFIGVVARALGVSQDRAGRIAVSQDLTVPGYPNIWVVGDAMSYQGLPGVAEVALQGGMHAGRQIRRLLKGKPRPEEKFHYRDLGAAAYISRYHGVMTFKRLRVSGLAGWFVWGFVHLAFLHGSRHRASTLASWMYSLARSNRTERAYPVGDLQTVSKSL